MDVQSPTKVSLQGHFLLVTSVCFHPHDSNKLLTASLDTTVKLWDIPRQLCLTSFSIHTGPVIHVVFTPSVDEITSCSTDGTVITFRVPSLPRDEDQFPVTGGVQLLQIGTTERLVAAAGKQGIELVDMFSGRLTWCSDLAVSEHPDPLSLPHPL